MARWGPDLTVFLDVRSVLEFVLAFERQWDAIPAWWRDKGEVIRWVRAQLSR